MSAAPRGSKLGKFVNYRVAVVAGDNRRFVGQLLGFDVHTNIILKDTEEYRRLNKRKAGEIREEKKNVGLIVLRGDCVKSVQIIGPPPPTCDRLTSSTASQVLNPGAYKEKKMSVTSLAFTARDNNALIRPTTGVASASANTQFVAPPTIQSSSLPQ